MVGSYQPATYKTTNQILSGQCIHNNEVFSQRNPLIPFGNYLIYNLVEKKWIYLILWLNWLTVQILFVVAALLCNGKDVTAETESSADDYVNVEHVPRIGLYAAPNYGYQSGPLGGNQAFYATALPEYGNFV